MSLIDKWNKKEKKEEKDQEENKDKIKRKKEALEKPKLKPKKKRSVSKPLKSKEFITQELESLAKTSDFKRLVYRAIIGSSQRGTIDELEADLTEYRKMLELLEEHNLDYKELKKLLESQK